MDEPARGRSREVSHAAPGRPSSVPRALGSVSGAGGLCGSVMGPRPENFRRFQPSQVMVNKTLIMFGHPGDQHMGAGASYGSIAAKARRGGTSAVTVSNRQRALCNGP